MTEIVVPVLTPDMVLATGDSGDDTARRYRYQWTYAAIVCCMLLDETEKVAEVFCEHHEDILIKYSDGSYSGLQIKTRAATQELWKANDEALKNSFVRFAKLEVTFPNQFRAFRFLTNHPIYAAENGQSISYILKKIKEAVATATVASLPGPIKTFVTQIARLADCTEDDVITTLFKSDASDDLPKLTDVELRLVSALTGTWNRANDCTLSAVTQAARSLSYECERASSLAHQDVLQAYLPAMLDPVATELFERIDGKRFTQTRLINLLTQGLNSIATLDGVPEALPEPGAGSTDLLLKKLAAGHFSAVSCNSAVDLRDKADYLGIKWTKKHGRESGLQRYSHIRSLVLSDAAGAFEDTNDERSQFGLKMLIELRARFQRRRLDGSQLFECSDEHLEGFSYSLTSECKVQWSHDRPWEVE